MRRGFCNCAPANKSNSDNGVADTGCAQTPPTRTHRSPRLSVWVVRPPSSYLQVQAPGARSADREQRPANPPVRDAPSVRRRVPLHAQAAAHIGPNRHEEGADHMSLRLIISPQPTNVVPLRLAGRGHMADAQPSAQRPRRDLTVVVVSLHRPIATAGCESCRREGG